MATTGEQSPTQVAVEDNRASTQRGDTEMEGARGVEASNGTTSDVLMTGSTPTIAATAEPQERNQNQKRPTSEAPKAIGDWRSRMKRTVRQQAQELTQLHRTIEHLAKSLEAYAACEEAQQLGVKTWMEEREEKWDFRHEDNILWAAGITYTIAEVMKAAASDQAARVKAVECSANDHQQVMTS
jgi:hypothetical protein